MKTLFRLITCLTVFLAVLSCASKTDLEQLEQRVDDLSSELDQLSRLVQQMNNGGYVVAVIPDADGNGYTLAFNDGSTVHLNLSVKSGGASPQTAGVTFCSVDTSDPDCVVITLSDGQQLRLPTWAAFDELRQEVKRLNINLASLSRIVSALQDYDYLVSTTPFVEEGVPVGWLLNFSKSGLVVIYSGSGGAAPQVGVRRDTDGVYYWTLGGEWLLDDSGRKVRAEGSKGADAVTPQFKIEDGSWWVTYDSGSTWSNLGSATGEPGDSLFKDVDVSGDEFVRLELSDGTKLTIPKYIPLDIVFDLPRDLLLDQWETMHIPYRIVGAQGKKVNVLAFDKGGIHAEVYQGYDADYNRDDNAGFIIVSSDSITPDGTVVVILTTESGASVVRSFNVSFRLIYVGDSRSKMYSQYTDPYVALAPPEGGTVSILYQSNSSFTLDLSDVPWVKVVQAYSGLKGEIVLKVDPSDGTARSGVIRFNYDDDSWSGYRTRNGDLCPPFSFSITQCAPGLEMDRNSILAGGEALTYSLEMRSNRGGLSAQAGYDWISASVDSAGEGLYMLNVKLDENYSGAQRRGVVYIRTAAGGQLVGCVDVTQSWYARPEDQMMVLKVVAKPENDYTVCLPYTGDLRLDVYWGDSNVSLIGRDDGRRDYPVRHKYKSCSCPTEFTVKAFGTAKAMTTTKEIERYVTVKSIESWGNFDEFEDMTDAFKNCTTLTSIDDAGPFWKVRSFTGAFEGCTNLTYVSTDLFCAATAAENFSHTFYGVGSVLSESPYVPMNGGKMHLYEIVPWFVYEGRTFRSPLYFDECFHGGHWADQEAIHASGWD